MRSSVRNQLRNHYRAVDTSQEPVEWAEIVARFDTDAPLVAVPRRRIRVGVWVAVAAVLVTILLIGAIPLLVNNQQTEPADTMVPTTLAESTPTTALSQPSPTSTVTTPEVVVAAGSNEVTVTVDGLLGYGGQELAGVLYEGNGVTDLGQQAVGGFWTGIDSDGFTTVQLVYQPDDWQEGPVPPSGMFPYVTDDVLRVEPGLYTLIVWVDYGFTPFSRWVPINTDGQGLMGCQHVFEVGEGTQTEVTLGGDLHPDGWNKTCSVP